MARRTTWQDRLVDTTVSSGGQAAPTLMTDISRDEGAGRTLTRMIGELSLSSATIAGAWGKQMMDIGIGLFDRDAAAAVAMSDPNVSSEQPPTGWVFRTRCVVAQNGTGAQVLYMCRFDLGAQRKIGAGVLHMIMNNTASTGTNFSVEVQGIVRLLFLMP